MKKFWKSFKLKAQLFKIWFLKNILLFLQIIGMICIICILTGSITESTPILGKIVYPIFKPLIDEIDETIRERDISNLMDFFTLAISILTSVGVFCMKCKSISQADIKSDKLKIALLNANLYFNSDGKLVKKMETVTQTDIDGDGKVNEDDIDTTSGNTLFHGGVINAVKEFVLISKADFSDDETTDEKYKEVLEDTNMTKSAEAVKDVDKIVKQGIDTAIADEADLAIDEKAEEIIDSTELIDEEKEKKISALKKFKTWIKNNFRHKKEETEDSKEDSSDDNTKSEDKAPEREPEVISNTIEEATKNDVDIISQDELKEIITPEETSKTKTDAKSSSKKSIDAFLDSLRNR